MPAWPARPSDRAPAPGPSDPDRTGLAVPAWANGSRLSGLACDAYQWVRHANARPDSILGRIVTTDGGEARPAEAPALVYHHRKRPQRLKTIWFSKDCRGY